MTLRATLELDGEAVRIVAAPPVLCSTATRGVLGYSDDSSGRRKWLSDVHAFEAGGGAVGWRGRTPFVAVEAYAAWMLARERTGVAAERGEAPADPVARMAAELGVELDVPASGRRRSA